MNLWKTLPQDDSKQLQENVARDAGFTIMELLVVIVILGTLTAIAAPAMFNLLAGAKASLVKQDIDAMGAVLENYKLDVGNFPTQEQGLAALSARPVDGPSWNGPYLRNISALNDPWNRRWIYAVPSRRENHDYDLCSPGPDGKGTGPSDGKAVCNP